MRLVREPIDHATWSNWSKHCDHSAKHDPHLRCALHRVSKREVSEVWGRVEEPFGKDTAGQRSQNGKAGQNLAVHTALADLAKFLYRGYEVAQASSDLVSVIDI